MRRITRRFGSFLAALAIMMTTLVVNSTCTILFYQDELPEEAKKLRKF